MQRLMLWIVDHRLISVSITLVATALLAIGLKDLKVDSSAAGLFVEGDPEVQYYKHAKEMFGDDVIHTIIIKSDDAFRPEILESLIEMTDAVESIDGVTRVVSMSTATDIVGSDGLIQAEELLPYVPEDPEELAALRERILKNPIFRGEVVNGDGTVLAIHMFLASRPDEEDFDGRFVREVQAIVDAEKAKLDGKATVYHVGPSSLKVSITQSIQNDGRTLTPLALIVLFVSLFLSFRSFGAVIIPGVTAILSVVMTLGLMGLLDYRVNPLSVIIPSLLMVIGSTEDMHLLAEYFEGLKEKMTRDQAIRNMAAKSGLAILLTSLTTFVGFLTIAPNDLPMLSEFGIAASFGILANFLITISIVPHLLRLFKMPKQKATAHGKIETFAESKLIHITRHYRKTLIVIWIVIIGLSCVIARQIVVNTDYLEFFRPGSDIRTQYRDVSQDLVGGNTFYVIVTTKEKGGIKDPAVLREVEKLQDYLAANHDKAMGYVDFLRKTNQEMNEGNPEYYVLPESHDMVAQYSLLMNGDDLARFVDSDFQNTCILVRSSLPGSARVNGAVEDIQAYIDANLRRDLEYHISGETILVSEASDTMTREVVNNLTLVFVVIFIVISILFMSVKAGLLAMLPNIAPVAVNFGIMVLLGIPLSTATFPVAVIAFGIAVDDTIHLMVRYSKEIHNYESNEEAMAATIRAEFRPVLSTSVALICGFGILVIAEFGSTEQFGILAAIAMFVALLADFLLTPALLLSTPLITSWDFLGMRVSRELAGGCPLFAGLKVNDIKRVAVMAGIQNHEAGTTMLHHGDESRNMYVVMSGEIRAEVDGTVVHEFREGDVFGEMALLNGDVRSADIVAITDVELLEINESTIARIRERFPRIAANLFYNLSQILSTRLKRTTTLLTEEK